MYDINVYMMYIYMYLVLNSTLQGLCLGLGSALPGPNRAWTSHCRQRKQHILKALITHVLAQGQDILFLAAPNVQTKTMRNESVLITHVGLCRCTEFYNNNVIKRYTTRKNGVQEILSKGSKRNPNKT